MVGHAVADEVARLRIGVPRDIRYAAAGAGAFVDRGGDAHGALPRGDAVVGAHTAARRVAVVVVPHRLSDPAVDLPESRATARQHVRARRRGIAVSARTADTVPPAVVAGGGADGDAERGRCA